MDTEVRICRRRISRVQGVSIEPERLFCSEAYVTSQQTHSLFCNERSEELMPGEYSNTMC